MEEPGSLTLDRLEVWKSAPRKMALGSGSLEVSEKHSEIINRIQRLNEKPNTNKVKSDNKLLAESEIACNRAHLRCKTGNFQGLNEVGLRFKAAKQIILLNK